MFAGGCGSGTLWRVGEGQVKLIMVVPFFAISASLMKMWVNDAEISLGAGIFMPESLGYGPTLINIGAVMMLWYVVVTWNEETNKLIVPM